MNNQFNEEGRQKFSVKSYLKFVGKFLGLLVLVFLLYLGWRAYQFNQSQKNLKALVDGLEKIRQEEYQKAMADTYGGHTPQETLQMYIDAVEKGDYVLASKYFVGDKQEGELTSLQNSAQKDINETLILLKKALISTGNFSDNKKEFVIHKPLLLDFILYPNGIWKILEI